MEEETVRRESEEIKKEPYDKPTLAKHGDLKDLTSGVLVGSGAVGAFGCTKLFL